MDQFLNDFLNCDVALQTDNTTSAMFETSAGGLGLPQANDALGRVPDALASFDAPEFFSSQLPSEFESFLNSFSGYDMSSFPVTEPALGMANEFPAPAPVSGIQEPSNDDIMFGLETQQAFTSLVPEQVQVDVQCLDPSTLLYHQPENSPGAVNDAGSSSSSSSSATTPDVESPTRDLGDSNLHNYHLQWALSNATQYGSASVGASTSSPFRPAAHFMSTPALTPSSTPAPSVTDSAGPSTPYQFAEDYDADEVRYHALRRVYSRPATPLAYGTPYSGSSSGGSSYHPTPEPSPQRPPSVSLLPGISGSMLVKEEDCYETELVGCLRTKRQEIIKVPWPLRRKGITERKKIPKIVNGKLKDFYECEYCGKHLGRHPDLYRHEKTHFISQKTLCCDVVKDLDGNLMDGCGSTFSRLDALERHRKGVCERQRADLDARLSAIKMDCTLSKEEKEVHRREIKRLAERRAMPKSKLAKMEASELPPSPTRAIASRRRSSRY